jgi:DnaJ-class molecular chaperone
MPVQDPYQTLGVSRSATQDEIRDAYRNLAKKFHPDLNPGKKAAEEKFKDLSAAYERIGTAESRTRYDRGESEEAQAGADPRRGPFYHRTQQGSGDPRGGRYTYSFGQGAEGMDEDLFESLFGSRGSRGSRGEDELYRIDIPLRDAVLGSETQFSLPSGKRLSVRIPPGIGDGTRLRFAGQGAASPSGPTRGDVYLEVRIRPDERFQRQGDDLILELPVSITEAVFGAEVRVPTLEGGVLLKIPPGSNTGTRLRVAGKGAKSRPDSARGDELVVLKVVLPRSIDAELEAALRQWKERHSYDPREEKAS